MTNKISKFQTSLDDMGAACLTFLIQQLKITIFGFIPCNPKQGLNNGLKAFLNFPLDIYEKFKLFRFVRDLKKNPLRTQEN